MKKKIVNGFLMMALLASSMGTFVSCKDYDEDSYVDLRSRYSDLQSQIDAINKWKATMKSCECDLSAYITKTYADATYATPADLTTAVKKLQDAIDALEKSNEGDFKSLSDQVNNLNQSVTDAANDAQQALNLLKNYDVDITNLKNDITSINNQMTDIKNQMTVWNDQLKTVMDSASYALTLAKTDSIRIVELQNKVADIEDKLANLNLNNHVWTIGTDGYWYDNGVKTDNKAIGEDGLKGEDGAKGADGKDADVWTIGDDGYWYLNGAKTDYNAIGQDGQNGQKGEDGANGTPGRDADIWTIGPDGYWYLNGNKTDNRAIGEKGDKGDKGDPGEAGTGANWTIGDDGYWYKDGNKTDYKALGEPGATGATGATGPKGEDGKDADVWSIGLDGYWYKNEVKTDYKAIGQDGQNGKDATVDLEQLTKDVLANIDLSDYATITYVDNAISNATKVANEAKTLANEVAESLKDYVTLKDLSDKVVELFQPGTDATKAVEKVMEDYFYTKSYIDTKLGDIFSNITKIQQDLKSQITDINVNAVYNPVIGYFNIPADVRTNVLMTYFGKADQKFVFPAKGGDWVDDNERFTDDEIAVMTAGGSLSAVEGCVTEEGGVYFAKDNGDGQVKLGTVYVTINPDNVDFEGQTLKLSNSHGDEPNIEFKPAAKSWETLTFGYGRTRSDFANFYKANAYMDINKKNFDDICLTLDIDNAKERIKNIYKQKLNASKADIVNLFVDLYKSVDDKLPAYCVKAEWTDNTVGKRAVRSDYSIAATALKPLSFNSLNLNVLKRGLPGRNRIYKLLDKIIHSIKIESPVPTTSNWITFQEIESDGGNKLTVKYETYIDGVYKTDTATIDLNDSEASDVRNLIEVLAESSEGTAKILAELINELNKIDSEWEQVFDDAETNMVNSLMKYVDKAYSKANSFYHLYTLLDLNMVVSEPTKGFKFLNENIERATPVTGEVTLFPTSNTLEYIAPAYKKYVAISNVYDAATMTALPQATAIAKAQAASGANMGVVIDGDTTCKLKGESGYIYEVSYAAVDYHGLKTRRSYYVKF